MGSGCGSSKTNGRCTSGQITSSHCVSWQGEAYENLGICTGDTLTEIGEVILNKLEDFAEGEGIKLSSLTTDCEALNVKLQNTDKSLFQIVKLALDNQCGLQTAIDQLQVQIDGLKITVDYSQLCEDIVTPSDLQQCMIDNIVNLKNQLEQLSNQLGQLGNSQNTIVQNINTQVGNTLLQKINSCNGGIQKNGSGENATLDFVGIVPPGGYIWGEFDISKFDSTGMGTGIYCGYALANGFNGTIDMRNRTASMAANIPGVTRSFADLTSIGALRGADSIILKANQLPDHEHNIQDTGHNHTYNYQGGIDVVGKNAGGGENTGGRSNITSTTSTNTTGVQVKGVKGTIGLPIDIRQSTIYQVWIKRVSGFSSVNTNQPITSGQIGTVGSGEIV